MMDTMTRAISKVAEKELGQPIIVENKPETSGSIALNHVLKSKPDGHTLWTCSTTSFIITPHAQRLLYNVLTDITDIITFA